MGISHVLCQGAGLQMQGLASRLLPGPGAGLRLRQSCSLQQVHHRHLVPPRHVPWASLKVWRSALQEEVAAGQQDVAASARRSLAHGPLLALRYCLEVLPWKGVPPAAASNVHVGREARWPVLGLQM